MDSKHIATAYYDTLALKLQEQVDEGQTEQELAFIETIFSPTDTLLDVGCGYGRIAKELIKKGYDVYGCDLSQEMITAANNPRFIVANMTELPYRNKQFSGIICLWSSFNSLLTKEEQLHALEEFYRVSSGPVILDMPNGDNTSHSLQRKREGEGPDGRVMRNYFMGPKNAIYVHTTQTIQELCEKSSFSRCDCLHEWFGGNARLVVVVYP